VLSQALREQAVALGLAADRLTIIPNGVDTTAFRPVPVEREPMILYVGSLIERKGLDSLLPAFAAVHGRVPTAKLLIIGEGPEADALRAMGEDLGIADQVTWLPFLPQADVRAWMQRARVLVLPSTEEGQGVVLLEAMACGTPVVGSRVGGIQDVITSDVGALVAPASPVELAEALIDLLDDAERWGSASQAARQRAVTSYDWDGLAKQFVALYQKIVARGNVLAKSD